MNFDYEIITDTCSNLTKEQAEKYGVKLMGFPYTVSGETHTDDPKAPTFKTKDFYELLKKKTDIKTSLINSSVIEEFFEPFLLAGKDIIYICISGGISGTYKSACTAVENMKEKYPERKIFVLDSLSGSYAQGILVLKTAKKQAEGADIEEAYKYASEIRNNIIHDFTINDLFFIKKSGRVSGIGAVIGSIAMIKPMFTLDKDGNAKVYAKANGRKKAISLIWNNFITNADPKEADFISVVHGDCEEEAKPLVENIKKLYPKAEILYDYLSPLVGAHTGPGTIGILYISKNKRD